MSLDLNSEEQAAIDQIERFSSEVLVPAAAAIDAKSQFATLHLPALAEMGIMGMNLPEAHGGIGLSGPALYCAVEAIAGACGSTASMLTAHFLATDSLLLGADEALQQRILPAAAAGQALGAFALTEPMAGSNPADMRSTATRDGNGYRLKGSKCFISNAGAADFIVVYAKTDNAAGARGVSAFVVEPAKTDGVEIGKHEETMGLRGGHVFPISFDCHVPAENRLGDEGTGFRTAMKVLDNGRIEVAAQATGIARAALDAAVSYAKEREVGGQPIGSFQGLQWMLADSATELAAARALGLQAARKRGTGERYSSDSAFAKLYASEAAWRIADRALQIHGGYGYIRDFPLERYLRDLRIFRIYEGSSEIQRTIIARELLS
ncbi:MULTISPECIES: acyl-CoA dehydrogenase family protein [Mameliella]|uniref:3-sulfinopropanoyl-CoA desulfinase n=1 Tax=Mameliella alba TaxID=561184 RepID=A0A0B3RL85_9RHOB|nr:MULTISPECIES: acyl-CoA dehydrogenase family protein [Mameliella]ODM46079.1 acyl-CoA dehydrogenase [Ruegeria sp. PBVC088]KHQ51985.1 Acyl-coa dehydrogenase, short-chain specific [Mameliella alba]MBY6120382.1 acyl-CoA dehydrogenase family protein [Mameliella alba]MDD9731026.1 acyl-CoA dehydrogenase family protein [Mameliella sp. AT18]OWV39841.1 acyl-CoA dehydrogenase [Mameliella alba]